LSGFVHIFPDRDKGWKSEENITGSGNSIKIYQRGYGQSAHLLSLAFHSEKFAPQMTAGAVASRLVASGKFLLSCTLLQKIYDFYCPGEALIYRGNAVSGTCRKNIPCHL